MLSLSIVIPAYNEAADLAAAVDEVSAGARRLGLPYEIIVVKDGSRDATGAVARALAGRVPRFRLVEHYPNRGYGGALKAGFAAAQYEWIAFIPADRQFVFHEIGLLAAQSRAADIVSGYRADRRGSFKLRTAWISRLPRARWIAGWTSPRPAA